MRLINYQSYLNGYMDQVIDLSTRNEFRWLIFSSFKWECIESILTFDMI